MKIDNNLLKDVLDLNVEESIECENLGLSYQNIPNMISFMDNEKFFQQLINNKDIKAIFVSEKLSHYFNDKNIIKIICDDPRFYFYSLKNYIGKASYVKEESKIDSTTFIHPKAYVCDYNVKIGKNVVIEPNVSILADVVIGDNCIIRSNSVIGSEGFEFKKTTKGILPVLHDGQVIIGNYVEIGSNTCIDKGFKNYPTVISDNVKIDNLVHVAHSVKIGENSLVVACSMLGGSSIIGDNSWIGPNASVSSQITIGNNAFVTLGSVVTRNIDHNQTVSGNFAIEHSKFINFIKSIR